MRDGALDARHLEEAALGFFNTLGDGGWHFLRLAITDADRTFAIANHDKCREAESATALDDLGDPVDGDDPFDVCGLLHGAITPAVSVATVAALTPAATTAALSSRHQVSSPYCLIRVVVTG